MLVHALSPSPHLAEWSRADMTIQYSTLWDKIKARCIWVGSCLVWQGAHNGKGHGVISSNGKRVYVHRAAYEHFHGPIPADLEIDHVRTRGCRFTGCCNEAHLEPVTHKENILRGVNPLAVNANKTHCPNGHELAGSNLRASGIRRGQRECRTCHLEYMRRWHDAHG